MRPPSKESRWDGNAKRVGRVGLQRYFCFACARLLSNFYLIGQHRIWPPLLAAPAQGFNPGILLCIFRTTLVLSLPNHTSNRRAGDCGPKSPQLQPKSSWQSPSLVHPSSQRSTSRRLSCL